MRCIKVAAVMAAFAFIVPASSEASTASVATVAPMAVIASAEGPLAHAASAPNVRCMRLPAAKRKLRRAGYRVRVRGGGIFGIVVERNWRVTGQRTSGNTVTLFVSRQC